MSFAGQSENSLMQRFRRKLQYSLFRQKWNIGITPFDAPAVAGLDGAIKQRSALDNVQWMGEFKNAFAADPFVMHSNDDSNDLTIFYEHFPWSEGRGRIDKVRFSEARFDVPNIALDSAFHLSYPFLYLQDGKYFVLPEHSASKNVSSYALDLAGNIRSKLTIGDHLEWVDSTILRWQEKFWIFATHAGPHDNSELYVYYADSLAGPWSMHAQNPVKTDKSNARPAGQFIYFNGSVFRPAQDCSSHYGSGIIVNKLEVLTEDQFQERPVSEVRPRLGDRYNYGLHTISSVPGYTVIDGARMESSISTHLDRFGRFFRT